MTLLTLPAMLASLELEAGTLTQGPDNGRHRSQPPPGQSGDWAVQTADAGLASVAGVTRTAGLVRGEEGAAGLVPGCGGVAGAAGAPAGAPGPPRPRGGRAGGAPPRRAPGAPGGAIAPRGRPWAARVGRSRP